MIVSRFGSPRPNDSANFIACFKLTLGGIGGSNGSTTAYFADGFYLAG
jgi:hypothetical protein